MAIDFNKPATTDNYSSAFVPALVAHQTALAQWLDSSQTTITGTPPIYAKRYNRSNAVLEEFNGAAWGALPFYGLSYSGGRLGVGTAAPSYPLDVAGSIAGSAKLVLQRALGGAYMEVLAFADLLTGAKTDNLSLGNSGGGALLLHTNNSERVRIDGAGNVGVGMTSPSELGAGYVNVQVAGLSGAILQVQNTGATVKGAIVSDPTSVRIGSRTAHPVLFTVNNNEVAKFDSSGNLGIGVSAPLRKLHVIAASSTVGEYGVLVEGLPGGYGAGISFQSRLGTSNALAEMGRLVWDGEAAWSSTNVNTQNSYVRLMVSRNGVMVDAVRVDSAGNLGINHANPGAYGKLVVADTNGTFFFTAPTVGYGDLGMVGGPGNVLRIGPSGYASGGVALMYTTAGSARTEGARLDGAGNFGVGKTAPLRRLDVAGAAMTSAVPVGFSATPTFDAASTNLIVFGNLTANLTSMAISNPQEGQFLSIRMRQDATGGRTVALPAGAAVSGTINTAANKTSYLNLTYNATDARWDGNWSQIP